VDRAAAEIGQIEHQISGTLRSHQAGSRGEIEPYAAGAGIEKNSPVAGIARRAEGVDEDPTEICCGLMSWATLCPKK